MCEKTIFVSYKSLQLKSNVGKSRVTKLSTTFFKKREKFYARGI